jgi:spermidine synthase
MKPWELLGVAQAREDGSELRLYRRDAEFSIRADGLELMNSRVHSSEEALGQLACERIQDRPKACVLVAGLGMGFTLAAALATLGASAKVLVSERVPEVVKWNRGPLGELARNPLADPRVRVREVGVARLIADAREIYEAILLDVDNGPTSMPGACNEGLYDRAGLEAAWKALRPKGVLALWSANPDPPFAQRLSDAGFAVEEITVRAHGYRKGARHTIWIGQRSAAI